MCIDIKLMEGILSVSVSSADLDGSSKYPTVILED